MTGKHRLQLLVVACLSALLVLACSSTQSAPTTSIVAEDVEPPVPASATPIAAEAVAIPIATPAVAAAAEPTAVPQVQATGELGPPAEPAGEPEDGPKGVVLEPIGKSLGRVRTIVLDPGHGGPEVGAVTGDLVEKHLNLEIALELADLLRQDGFRVVLTRDGDRAVSPSYVQAGVRSQLTLDLQARVDIANRANGDLFLSIHNNGSGDPSQRGTEVWFNAARPFSDRNRVLAELVLSKILGRLRESGYDAYDRGIKDDAHFRTFRGRTFNIYVLGPGNGNRPHLPTQMPGVLGESLILSNPDDAAALRRSATLGAIAAGYRDAVLAYFERFPE